MLTPESNYNNNSRAIPSTDDVASNGPVMGPYDRPPTPYYQDTYNQKPYNQGTYNHGQYNQGQYNQGPRPYYAEQGPIQQGKPNYYGATDDSQKDKQKTKWQKISAFLAGLLCCCCLCQVMD